MSKNGLLLVSLVGAIPGAVLVYLMVMAFVSFAAGPSLWPKALAGLALLIGLLLAVMPVGIFVFGGPKAEKASKKEESEEAEGEAAIIAESHDDLEASEADSASGATDPSLEVVDADSEEFARTGEIVTSDDDIGSEEFDLGSDFEIGEAEGEHSGDAVEVIDADDDFEEEAPKKKKK